VDAARVRDVTAEGGQQRLVRVDEHIDRAVADFERRDMWKEVVPHKEAEEDEIVDDALEVESPRHLWGRGRRRGERMHARA
jgi:hypothetical protein